jgi:hypothetical protein
LAEKIARPVDFFEDLNNENLFNEEHGRPEAEAATKKAEARKCCAQHPGIGHVINGSTACSSV